MAVNTTIESLSTNPSLNGPDGSVDPPSTLDDQLRYHGAFIAQVRDGSSIPAGVMFDLTGSTAPAGYVKGTGILLNRVDYPRLLAFAMLDGLVSEADWTAGAFGRYSVGDGVTTFRIPDIRGMVIRGLDESRGIDAGRALGKFQDQDNAPHIHAKTETAHNHAQTPHNHGGTTDAAGNHQHSSTDPQASGITAVLGFPGGPLVNVVGGNTGTAGNHQHGFTTGGSNANIQPATTNLTINSQGVENRVKNLAYPKIIKY